MSALLIQIPSRKAVVNQINKVLGLAVANVLQFDVSVNKSQRMQTLQSLDKLKSNAVALNFRQHSGLNEGVQVGSEPLH